MSVPPLVLDLRVAPAGKRPVRLWLPLVLLWPVGLVAGALGLAIAAVLDAVSLAAGRPYHSYTVLLVRALGTLGETRGTVISFSNEKTTVHVTVQ
jgi:hypothetical protein